MFNILELNVSDLCENAAIIFASNGAESSNAGWTQEWWNVQRASGFLW